jgi:hypothetical protein
MHPSITKKCVFKPPFGSFVFIPPPPESQKKYPRTYQNYFSQGIYCFFLLLPKRQKKKKTKKMFLRGFTVVF